MPASVGGAGVGRGAQPGAHRTPGGGARPDRAIHERSTGDGKSDEAPERPRAAAYLDHFEQVELDAAGP